MVLCLCSLFERGECQPMMGVAIPLSGNEIEELVSVHNALRAGVEPRASNMRTLVSTFS